MTHSMSEELRKKFKKKNRHIADWLGHHFKSLRIPIYTSVVLQDAHFKVSAVDTSLFPNGFHNLCQTDLRYSISLFKKYIKDTYSQKIKKILIIPEISPFHLLYLENLYVLTKILVQAGFEVELGAFEPLLGALRLSTAFDHALTISPTMVQGDTLRTEHFIPDLILLNRDFSDGVPESITKLRQPITPLSKCGSFSRKKSDYFHSYNGMIQDLAQILETDSWLLSPLCEVEENVNLLERGGIEKIAAKIESVLQDTQIKYNEYKIKESPFVVLKNNIGTYGMGVMSVRSGKELLDISRKMRQKMPCGKGAAIVNNVFVQEGIPTAPLLKAQRTEPVTYLIGGQLAGGYFRFYGNIPKKGNNRGESTFQPLCLSKTPHKHSKLTVSDSKDLYGCIAKIACLAAVSEIQQVGGF